MTNSRLWIILTLGGIFFFVLVIAARFSLADDIRSVPRNSSSQVAPAGPTTAAAERVEATQIAVEYHDGQTFITWKDAAEGEQAARYRYSIYRSDKPITDRSLASAKLIEEGIPYNSAKLYGTDFSPKDRLDPSKPTAKLRYEGTALPQWSGLAVYTVKKSETAYYAVVVTDASLRRLGKVHPGSDATTTGLDEKVAAPQPIKIAAAAERPQVPPSTVLLQQAGLPMMLTLHASSAGGGQNLPYGDFYLYFGTDQMGYRDGLPGMFSVEPAGYVPGRMLELYPRDAILKPDASGALETYWFGYYCSPQWGKKPHAYPFTENRLLWLLDWAIRNYHIDRERVYAGGPSMGGWGTATFAFRHPEIFAAIYPRMPRFRQIWLQSLIPASTKVIDVNHLGATERPTLADGTDYFKRMDMVDFAAGYPGELPFIGWSIGRHDGFASWKEQVDMARAMAATRRGFAFAWNNGGHSEGSAPMEIIWKYYPPEKFRRDTSYPAFTDSSIDNDPGNGDPENGDKEGGINLGFDWQTPIDTEEKWSTAISNRLAKETMTVDVTPRRLQNFKLSPGVRLTWHASSGQSGTATADPRGLVTIRRLQIMPTQETTITIERR